MPQQPISRAAQAALLAWVNTFPLDRRVERYDDLVDGQVFAQMLHDLDADYDPAELEQNAGSSAWLTNKRNVQSVFKAFTKYAIHRDTSGTIDFLPRTVDFRAISDNLNADGLAQLVALFAAAAMLGGHNTRYIPIMRTNLSTSEQAAIMSILQRKDEERQRMAADGLDATIDEATAALDPGLMAEAQLATLASDYDRLSKRLADSNTRLEHLQISYEQIKEDLERKEKELDLERQKAGASESQLVRDLQDKLREQDDLIGNQEAQAEDDRQVKQRLTQENAQLARKAGLVEGLQDQVQELRHANEELSKKANTVDRFKQKLEAQRGLETDLQNAMYELSQNKEALKELEALQRRTSQQQATIERFREMVSGLEQQIEDNRIQKTAVESDIYSAHVQLESLKEQNQLSEARISELEQQLLLGGSGKPPHTPDGTAASGGFNLEEELQHTADPAAAYTLEITRLRAENKLLRGRVDAGAETDRLRADLEATRAKEERSRAQYQELFEKHTVMTAQMQTLARGEEGALDGGAVLVAAQQQAAEATAELRRQQATGRELEAAAADRQREVLRLQANLEAVANGLSAEALAGLKATDELVSASLEKELASLRADYRKLQLDRELQQKQLIDALLSKEELRKAATDFEQQTAATASPTSPPAGPGSAGLEEQVRKTQEKNEKLRAAMAKLKKQYDAVDQERFELQRKVKAAESSAGAGGAGAAAAAAARAQEQMLRNLQRENALMATAWHDLTSRLQSNHVALQRRADGPKSWLNKQRQMVNATPRK